MAQTRARLEHKEVVYLFKEIMKKIQKKVNFFISIIFLLGSLFLFNFIDEGKWKYLGPALLIFLSFANLLYSFEKYTDHEKRYPAGFGAIIYLQGLKQLWKDIKNNKEK